MEMALCRVYDDFSSADVEMCELLCASSLNLIIDLFFGGNAVSIKMKKKTKDFILHDYN